jgi:hypothetical protein
MATFLSTLLFMPSVRIKETESFYTGKLGFISSDYMSSAQPHICLYRDMSQVVLFKSAMGKIVPNRELHGSGYDAYFITNEVEEMYLELKMKGVRIIREIANTDYKNEEFVIEDNEGRWIGIGIKRIGLSR